MTAQDKAKLAGKQKKIQGAPSAQTASSKRELLASVMHLRLVGAQLARFIEEQMPLFMGASSEFEGGGEPKELLRRWRKADKGASGSYGPADEHRLHGFGIFKCMWCRRACRTKRGRSLHERACVARASSEVDAAGSRLVERP